MDKKKQGVWYQNFNKTWVNPKTELKVQCYTPEQTLKRIVAPDRCICQRSKCLVVCTICGYNLTGRVRQMCPAHAQTIYLMDLARCPNPKCMAPPNTLKEYR